MSKQIKLPTLLVVTSNPSVRFWLKKHLDEQFFVIGAESRKDALAALNARLDFIIVDESFEECKALDLCAELNQLSHKNQVPILLITGRLKKSFRDKAKKSGVTDFLSNQLDAEELEERIASGFKVASTRQRTESLSLAISMPKTGNSSLKNKFVLSTPALQLISSAKKDNVPISLLLIRIDHFENKDILQPFAQFLNKFIRANDVIIPSSEGKFIVLLYNIEIDHANQLAAKLQDALKRQPFQLPNGPTTLTVSIAVSPLKTSEQGFNKIIDSAFKSLKTHSETNLIISLDMENL